MQQCQDIAKVSIFRCFARTASRCRRAYILPLWFFFSSTPNLWGHWTDLNQTWTHIHLWLLFEKRWSELPRAFTPHGLESKNRFFVTDFELWPNLMSKIENILISLQEFPTFPKFDELWSRNGWERLASFCPPPKFSHWETLPALPHGRYINDSRQTLVDMCYVVARTYSLDQQNAGRARDGLCHASSSVSADDVRFTFWVYYNKWNMTSLETTDLSSQTLET